MILPWVLLFILVVCSCWPLQAGLPRAFWNHLGVLTVHVRSLSWGHCQEWGFGAEVGLCLALADTSRLSRGGGASVHARQRSREPCWCSTASPTLTIATVFIAAMLVMSLLTLGTDLRKPSAATHTCGSFLTAGETLNPGLSHTGPGAPLPLGVTCKFHTHGLHLSE